MKKKLRQRGIDPLTHRPLSETEINNGDQVDIDDTEAKSRDKVSSVEVSNDLNLLLKADINSKPEAAARTSPFAAPQGYEKNVIISSSNESNANMLLDRLITATLTNCQPSDFVGQFSLEQQLNYGSSSSSSSNTTTSSARLPVTNLNPLAHTAGKTFGFDINSARSPSCNAIPVSFTTTTTYKPWLTFPNVTNSDSFSIYASRYWEGSGCGTGTGGCASTNNGSGSSSTQSGSSFLDNTMSSRGLAAYCSTSVRELPHIHLNLVETNSQCQRQSQGQQEDIKWAEYLSNPTLMAAPLQSHQTSSHSSLFNSTSTDT